MTRDRLAVGGGGLAGEQLPERPGAVARMDQIAVEPDDIGDRPDQQERRKMREDFHRDEIGVAPIPAADRVDQRNDSPGRP